VGLSDYDIVGSYNNQRYTPIDAERTINMFEYLDNRDKKPKTLIPTSGLINKNKAFFNSFTGLPQTGPFRAQFTFQDSMYCVIGTGVYKLTGPTLTLSFLEDIGGTGIGYVGIDANTYQVIFVDGTNGWIYDTLTGIFLKITDPSFPDRPVDVTYLDGFFVVANGLTNTFQLSEFNQGLVWGPDSVVVTWNNGSPILIIAGVHTNFPIGTRVTFNTPGAVPTPLVAGTTYFVVSSVIFGGNTLIQVSATSGGSAIIITQAGTGTTTMSNNGELQLGSMTSHPGTIVACRTLHRRLFLFSQNYTEVWENAGLGTTLPFRRNNSLLIEYGTPSVASIRVGLDMMFFLSQDKEGQGSVMMVIGAQAIPVSIRALDFELAQFAADDAVSDSTGILIKENGLIFYKLNFTKAQRTFVYNVNMSNPENESERLWHEEQVLNGTRHLAQTHAYINGNNYYGDYLNPILYQVDATVTTNAGEAIPRIRIGKGVVPDGYNRLRIDRFQVDLLQGQALTTSVVIPFDASNVNIGFSYIEVPDTSEFVLGSTAIFSTLNTLPSPLVAGTVYYIIIISPTKLLFADTYTHAAEGVFIPLTTTGTAPNSVNIVTPVPYNPTVFLSISKDGGQTYGNKLLAPMGKIGERSFRTVWRKLGTIPRGQAFVPKIEFYNQVPFVLMGGAWYSEVMPE
jgi:hypothetical protein